MSSADSLRSLVVPDGDGYGLARVVVAVRVAVVLSIVVLVATGPDWMRHQLWAQPLSSSARRWRMPAVLMARPQFEVRRTRYSWLVAAVDASMTLTLIALTGGAASPVVVVLVLAVIASAARLSFIECLVHGGAGGRRLRRWWCWFRASDPDAVLDPPGAGSVVGAVSGVHRGAHRRAVGPGGT